MRLLKQDIDQFMNDKLHNEWKTTNYATAIKSSRVIRKLVKLRKQQKEKSSSDHRDEGVEDEEERTR